VDGGRKFARTPPYSRIDAQRRNQAAPRSDVGSNGLLGVVRTNSALLMQSPRRSPRLPRLKPSPTRPRK
jgi:hypothetical protein